MRNIFITGYTGSTDFPTTAGAFQSTYYAVLKMMDLLILFLQN